MSEFGFGAMHAVVSAGLAVVRPFASCHNSSVNKGHGIAAAMLNYFKEEIALCF